MKTPLLLAAALSGLAACVAKDDARKPLLTTPVLQGVPVPASARMIDSVVTADAGRAVFRVAMAPDSVAAFYRRELPRLGFRIVADVSDPPKVDLYAQREGPSLWIRIQPGAAQGGTEFALVGAVAPAPARPAAGDSARKARPR